MDGFEADVWDAVAEASAVSAENLNQQYTDDALMEMDFTLLAVIVTRLQYKSRLAKWKWPRILRCWEM